MMATQRTPARPESAGSACGSGEESILTEQRARWAEVVRDREAQGQSTHRARAVLRSLENTMTRMAKSGGSLVFAETDFVIRAPGREEIELWRGRTKLPVDPRVLREALEDGGVQLVPGEAIFADPDLVRQVTEETLVQCSLEEFRLREKKSLLLRNLVDLPDPSAKAS